MMDHLAATTHPGLTFGSREEALEWLYSEAQSLLAAVEQTTDGGCAGLMRRAADLMLAAWDLMESGIHSRQYEQAARALVTAAHACADSLVEGRARLLMAQLLRMTGRFAEADEAGAAGHDRRPGRRGPAHLQLRPERAGHHRAQGPPVPGVRRLPHRRPRSLPRGRQPARRGGRAEQPLARAAQPRRPRGRGDHQQASPGHQPEAGRRGPARQWRSTRWASR